MLFYIAYNTRKDYNKKREGPEAKSLNRPGMNFFLKGLFADQMTTKIFNGGLIDGVEQVHNIS